MLVRGIFLPVAQLFVIAIENILRGGVDNLTSLILKSLWIFGGGKNPLKLQLGQVNVHVRGM